MPRPTTEFPDSQVFQALRGEQPIEARVMRSSYLGEPNPGCFQNACSPTETCQCCVGECDGHHVGSHSKTGGGATGTIRPSTSPRMPTSGFEGGHKNLHGVHNRPQQSIANSARRTPEPQPSTLVLCQPTPMPSVTPSGPSCGPRPRTLRTLSQRRCVAVASKPVPGSTPSAPAGYVRQPSRTPP